MKNKILFWIPADLIHYCIAYYLQKHFDCELYAIIDVTNNSKKFFETQTLVKFKKIWFFHDFIKINKIPDFEYLQKIEENYKINLWKLAINERIFYRFYNFHKFTSDEILSIDESACKLFESIFNEIKPQFFITKEPAFHHLQLCYEMSIAKGIIPLVNSRPNYSYEHIISQEPNKIDFIINLDDIVPKGRNFKQLQDYLQSFDYSEQIDFAIDVYGGGITEKFKAAYNFFIKSDNSNEKDHYNYYGRTKFKVFLYTISEEIKLRFRQKFMDTHLVKKINLKNKFVYYPMGVDLERNLLIGSPFFNNQTEVIRYIAKSLPPGYKLYVKETPGQSTRQWRSKSEYNEIISIPNVTLIHPTVKNLVMLQNCSLVVTIIGTSGIEAAVYEKPTIVFADVGYRILPSVFRVTDPETLPSLIRKALNTKVNAIDVDKYFTLYEQESFHYNYFEFEAKLMKTFFHSGNFVDTEITETQMLKYLNENQESYELLANEYIKKILLFNSINNVE